MHLLQPSQNPIHTNTKKSIAVCNRLLWSKNPGCQAEELFMSGCFPHGAMFLFGGVDAGLPGLQILVPGLALLGDAVRQFRRDILLVPGFIIFFKILRFPVDHFYRRKLGTVAIIAGNVLDFGIGLLQYVEGRPCIHGFLA